eukprot:TRINITY_DN2166_c1_g2_i1.p1 TRINITY_DN2166_c1_g2~~TRINITY_DN2166_c1_g2_i1.p1  ORF type:complete len:541 (+),score=139.59 TRINITY_DN2166_c1_g2_i1:178-1800(+)
MPSHVATRPPTAYRMYSWQANVQVQGQVEPLQKPAPEPELEPEPPAEAQPSQVTQLETAQGTRGGRDTAHRSPRYETSVDGAREAQTQSQSHGGRSRQSISTVNSSASAERGHQRWGNIESAPNTLQTTASVCIALKRLRDELLAGCEDMTSGDALARCRFALNPYCKPSTLRTLVDMTRVSVFIFTSIYFVDHLPASAALSQKQMRDNAWATLCANAPVKVEAVTRTDEIVVIGRATVPGTDGTPATKYFVVFNSSVDVAVNALKLVGPQFEWFRIHCLLDLEERAYDSLIKDVVALAPADDSSSENVLARRAGAREDRDARPGLRYYTDLTEDHPVVAFFQGKSVLEAFVWDGLSYSGYYDYSDRGSVLDVVVRPHVQTLHYWKRASECAAAKMAVMLVQGSITSQMFTESFDGVVVSQKTYELLHTLGLGEAAVARLKNSLHVMPDDFLATDTATAATRFLQLCADRRWSQVATTVFESGEHNFSEDALMDNICDWKLEYPSFITIFHAHKDDFAAIKDGFTPVTSVPPALGGLPWA